MKNIVSLTIFAFLLFSSFTTFERKEVKVRTVVIDAGHGGKDTGCNGTSAREKDVALKVALKLGELIQENIPDVKVVYTRKDDRFVELIDRAGIANKNHADLFVSIHCNSGPSAAYGTETYTMGQHKSDGNLAVAKRENSVVLQEENYEKKYNGFNPNSPQNHILFSLFQSAYLDNSLRFAQKVEKEFKTKVGRSSRGVKQAGFLVLWKSAMPSTLIEIGFLTNPTEERFLNDKTNQTYMASGIYRAFRDYKRELEAMN
ncbi:N-acetylmuramoyl-L-alanine amidase family protein [Rufibacter tibetensis]|uniref:N-acetylmuramoyl-L-alanine amidase n=1 Tax=Rufibacter tibetensis TaxID=512763 RepID=A0A0P0CJJ0_9BACT|nr:N-acetylmuramoyl-L-alanine amidase [Rufibacter tibetensis]ALI99602.1 N-acetylmuramoyl-L-alanine amidase [Rufibacter tibetensis]